MAAAMARRLFASCERKPIFRRSAAKYLVPRSLGSACSPLRADAYQLSEKTQARCLSQNDCA
jgi:hypothetical protein